MDTLSELSNSNVLTTRTTDTATNIPLAAQHPVGLTYANPRENHSNDDLIRARRNKANANRRIKEQRIKQLIPLEQLFEQDYKYPSYFVITFPGMYIDSQLNVISAENDIKNSIGNLKKITKLNKNSLLIQITEENQIERIRSVTHIAGNPVVIEQHRSMNSVRGTVYSEALSQSSELEILEKLADQGVQK